MLRAGVLLSVLPLSPAGWAGDGGVIAKPRADSTISEVVWNRPLGAGYVGLAHDDGLLVTSFVEEERNVLAAFDAVDGSEYWKVDLGPRYPGVYGAEDGPVGTVCIHEGMAYGCDPTGVVVAVELETGEGAWRVDVGAQFGVRQPTYGFGPCLLGHGSTLFVPAFGQNGMAGLALDVIDGGERWRRRGGFVNYQPSVVWDGNSLLAVDSNWMECLERDDGRVRWRFQHEPNRGGLAYPTLARIGDDRLLLGYEDRTDLLRSDGSVGGWDRVWSSRELEDCYHPAQLVGDTLYGMDGTFLAAVDLATGRRRWKSREPGTRGVVRAGEHLAMLSSTGDFVLARCDPERYVELTRTPVFERGAYTVPLVVGDRAFLRNTESLACVRWSSASTLAERADQGLVPESWRGVLATLAQKLVVSADPDADARDWYESFAELPLREDGFVHFVYYGDAADVALVGDPNEQRLVPETLHRFPGTRLFARSVPMMSAGPFQYTYLVDFDQAIRDPRNSHSAPTLSEQAGNPLQVSFTLPSAESVVHAPNWSPADYASRPTTCAIDRKTIGFRSSAVFQTRPLTVLRPADADAEALPVLLVVGGDAWLGHGQLQEAMAAFMGSTCARATIVSIPYHEGSRDRLGADEYSAMIRDDVLPLLEREFGTLGEISILGVADDACAAWMWGVLEPKCCSRMALLSPGIGPEELLVLHAAESLPSRVHIEWTVHETTIHDEGRDDRASTLALLAELERRGVKCSTMEHDCGPGWLLFATALERVLPILLPKPQ